MKKIIILLITSLCLFGCGNKQTQKVDLDKYTKPSINELLEEKEYIIIDVRTKEEYNESHIKGSINIPVDEINEKIDLDKDKNILVYCKSGNRSAQAAESLTNLGYNVYDLGAFSSIDLPKE